MNERGCLQVSSWEVPPVERGRRKEGPCSDLSLPLPCNPACFWSSIAGDVIPLPYPRSKETVWAADVHTYPACGAHSQPRVAHRPKGSWSPSVSLTPLGTAGQPGAPLMASTRGLWYIPTLRPATSAVSSGSPASLSGIFLAGGLVGRPSWPWGP